MAHFLGIVLRNQFNLFYRFGYTFLSKSELVEFDGNITIKTKKQIVKKFAEITPFEYDEEYLILHLEKLESEDNVIRFETQDIVAIYPLSQQAKISIESKIDRRIKLEKPIFEVVLPEIESEIKQKEVEKAISALWTICKIEKPQEKYLSDIGIENIFKGLEHRKQGTKANKIQNGNYWEYLIAYDRFDYFPNSMLGYFYDAGQVFAFNKGLQTFEGSGLHNFLENLNSENSTAKFLDIIKYFETEEQLKSYISQTTIGNTKQYIVAPLYLMLRNEIRDSDDISKTNLVKNLDYLKTFDDNFYYAAVLLGAFFGFSKFYDLYYDTLNLRFYKNHKELEEEVKTEKVENNTIVESINNANLTQKDEQQKTNEFLQYRIIIENALKEKSEIKLTDLANLIKEQTKKTFNNTNIKGIIREMKGVEIVKIGKSEGAKRKENTETLVLFPNESKK